jgi:hypothetical protein
MVAAIQVRHGTFYCTCGDLITRCRCSQNHIPQIVANGCDKCKTKEQLKSKGSNALVAGEPLRCGHGVRIDLSDGKLYRWRMGTELLGHVIRDYKIGEQVEL